MRSFTTCLILAAMAVAAVVAQPAAASITPIDDGYEFCYGTAGFQSLYEVEVGQTVDIDIYLYEHLANSSFLLEDKNGVVIAGFMVSDSGTSATEPAYVLSVDDIAENPDFTETAPYSPVKSVSGHDVVLVQSMHYTSTDGVQPITIDTDTIGVYLGTLTYTAGSVVGETTSLVITDNDPASYDNVTFDPEIPFDELICSFEFDIVTVPEPATMLLLAAGALGLLRRRRAA